jgi:hypothetical protein
MTKNLVTLMSLIKNPDDVFELTEAQFLDFMLRLTSCEEAINVFPDMFICPCCLSVRDDSMTINHKPRFLYTH